MYVNKNSHQADAKLKLHRETPLPVSSLPPLWKAIKKFAPLLVALERDDFTLQKNIIMQATTITWDGIIPAAEVQRFTMAKIAYEQYPVLNGFVKDIEYQVQVIPP